MEEKQHAGFVPLRLTRPLGHTTSLHSGGRARIASKVVNVRGGEIAKECRAATRRSPPVFWLEFGRLAVQVHEEAGCRRADSSDTGRQDAIRKSPYPCEILTNSGFLHPFETEYASSSWRDRDTRAPTATSPRASFSLGKRRGGGQLNSPNGEVSRRGDSAPASAR